MLKFNESAGFGHGDRVGECGIYGKYYRQIGAVTVEV